MVLCRYVGAAGRKDWYWVRNVADLDTVFTKGRPSDSYTVFLQPQLPHRGTASPDLCARALEGLVDEAELLFGVITGGVGPLDWINAYAPDADAIGEVTDWFDEHEGDPVAFGPYPPFWTDDEAIAVTGYVPRADGTVHVGAY